MYLGFYRENKKRWKAGNAKLWTDKLKKKRIRKTEKWNYAKKKEQTSGVYEKVGSEKKAEKLSTK